MPENNSQEPSSEQIPAAAPEEAGADAAQAEAAAEPATASDGGEAAAAQAEAAVEASAAASKPSDKSNRQIIELIEAEQMRKLDSFCVGDTVAVKVNVIEGSRKRIQTFNGVVIAKRNRGLNSSFRVRKKSRDESVERVFQTHSPLIQSVNVKTRGRVRRAKLYYLRKLSGLAARIEEKIN